jgi:hypothetical protein
VLLHHQSLRATFTERTGEDLPQSVDRFPPSTQQDPMDYAIRDASDTCAIAHRDEMR